jgi:hypothetical protein
MINTLSVKKNTTSLDVTLCIPAEFHRRFGETYASVVSVEEYSKQPARIKQQAKGHAGRRVGSDVGLKSS